MCLQAAARSVRLDGDVILQQSEVLHWQAEGAGSMVDIRSVCSCTCQSCNPFQQGRTKPAGFEPACRSMFVNVRVNVKMLIQYLIEGTYISTYTGRGCIAIPRLQESW